MKRLFIVILSAALLCGCGVNSEDDVSPVGSSYDNTKICWGLKKVKNSSPEVPQNVKELLKKYNGFYVGDESKKELYLTFDEGYENGYTAQILDVLKETETPAAFFVTGHYINTCADLVKRMAEDGHIVGNHSVNHPSFPEIDNSKLRTEVEDLSLKYKELTGKDMVYLRALKGEFSERTLAVTNEMGYKNIFWSSAYADWDINCQIGKENAREKVVSQFHNGNIILLHAVSKDNADALFNIINDAKAMGYTFKSLDNL